MLYYRVYLRSELNPGVYRGATPNKEARKTGEEVWYCPESGNVFHIYQDGTKAHYPLFVLKEFVAVPFLDQEMDSKELYKKELKPLEEPKKEGPKSCPQAKKKTKKKSRKKKAPSVQL